MDFQGFLRDFRVVFWGVLFGFSLSIRDKVHHSGMLRVTKVVADHGSEFNG